MGAIHHLWCACMTPYLLQLMGGCPYLAAQLRLMWPFLLLLRASRAWGQLDKNLREAFSETDSLNIKKLRHSRDYRYCWWDRFKI